MLPNCAFERQNAVEIFSRPFWSIQGDTAAARSLGEPEEQEAFPELTGLPTVFAPPRSETMDVASQLAALRCGRLTGAEYQAWTVERFGLPCAPYCDQVKYTKLDLCGSWCREAGTSRRASVTPSYKKQKKKPRRRRDEIHRKEQAYIGHNYLAVMA